MTVSAMSQVTKTKLNWLLHKAGLFNMFIMILTTLIFVGRFKSYKKHEDPVLFFELVRCFGNKSSIYATDLH